MASRSERGVVALTAAALVPVWLFRYFPTQDGPSHVYNAFILARLGDASSDVLRQYFTLNARLVPNLTMYAVMAPLTRLVPPLLVQQFMLSLCVIAVPAAVVFLQRETKGEVDGAAFLGVALAYSALFFLGFFNFILGAALFLVIVALAHRPERTWRVYGLLALTYFTHVLPFAAAVLALTIIDATRKRWRVFAELSPAFAILGWDALHRIGAMREYRSIGWHLRHLLDLGPFVYFGAAHVWIARVALVLIVAAIVMSRRRPALVYVTASLFLLYWILPWGYGAGGWSLGGWINDRLLFLALLTLPGWVELPRRLGPVLLLLAVMHLGITAVEIARFHRRMAWIDAARPLVRPHSTLARLGGAAETLHVGSYLALNEDVVSLDNYEARLPDFPVTFRRDAPARPPDYVLVWNDARVRNVSGYRILYTGEEIRLFVRAGL